MLGIERATDAVYQVNRNCHPFPMHGSRAYLFRRDWPEAVDALRRQARLHEVGLGEAVLSKVRPWISPDVIPHGNLPSYQHQRAGQRLSSLPPPDIWRFVDHFIFTLFIHADIQKSCRAKLRVTS